MAKPRLVIFELHHLGDAVMALPFLRSAQAHYDVTVVCRVAVADFLRQVRPDLKLVDAPPSWPSLAATAKNLKLTAGDAVTCVWADARVHLLMLLTGAKIRVGFPMTRENYYAADLPWRRRRLHFGKFLQAIGRIVANGPLLTVSLQRKSASQSHLESWTQLAGGLGFLPNLDLPWISSGETTLPTELAGFLEREDRRALLVIHPGGRLVTKRWPHFQELVEKLTQDKNLAVVIVQPPDGEAPQPLGDHQLLIPAPDWPELFSLFRAANAILCNDSFPAHLAAALGKPVVAIFGSGEPAWFAPFGNTANIALTNACPYRPCIDRCVMPSVICLESVTVELVESRLRRILDAG